MAKHNNHKQCIKHPNWVEAQKKQKIKYEKLKELMMVEYYKTPKICELDGCNNSIEYDKRNTNKFCCSSCSTKKGNKKRKGIKKSNEFKTKVSEGVKNSEKYQKSLKINKELNVYKRNGQILKEKSDNKILNVDFETLSYERLRKRIILEQNGKCNVCNLDVWMKQPLTLELEHKDGCNENNNRSNLEALCPNCHSLTKTWRGRNKKKIRIIKTDIEYIEAYLKHDTIRQALFSLGLAGKGGNYNKMYKIIKEYSVEKVH